MQAGLLEIDLRRITDAMKSNPSQVQALCSKLAQSSARTVLLFGPNEGLADELRQRLAKAFAPEDGVTTYQSAEVRKSPALLVDDLAEEALFATKKCLLVREATDAALKGIEQAANFILSRSDRLLLIQAGSLTGGSKLKKAAEASAAIVSCACYEESAADVLAFLNQAAATDFGIRLDSEAAEAMRTLVGDDRMLLRSALANCALYAHGQDAIDQEIVQTCLVSQSAASLEAALQAVFGGQPAALARDLARLEGDETPLLIACQRHAMRLVQVKAGLESGHSFQAAAGKLRPPLFWKQKDSFKRQVDSHSLVRLSSIASRLKALTFEARAQQENRGTHIGHGLLDLSLKLSKRA